MLFMHAQPLSLAQTSARTAVRYLLFRPKTPRTKLSPFFKALIYPVCRISLG
jgi:hypothetical protein